MGAERSGEAWEKAVPATSLSFTLKCSTSGSCSHRVRQAHGIGKPQRVTFGARSPKASSYLDAGLRPIAAGGGTTVDNGGEGLCQRKPCCCAHSSGPINLQDALDTRTCRRPTGLV